MPADQWIKDTVRLTQEQVAAHEPFVERLHLPMPVRRILAHAGVEENAGKAAIQRGPVLYAIEGVDNGDSLADLTVPMSAEFATAFHDDLLGGVQALTTVVEAADGTARTVMAVPYFSWANRGRGEMVVWAKQ